jgi:acetyl esterase
VVETTFRESVEAAVARGLLRLPVGVQRLLAGKPIRRDGLELHPTSQLLIRLSEWSGGRLIEELPVERARAQTRVQAHTVGQPRIELARVEDVSIPGPAGPLGARLYVPEAKGGAPADTWLPTEGGGPLLVYYHGGGHVIGDLDTHDPACRFIADAAAMAVLSIDYRLAPEHPFPAAVEDAVAALAWACENAGRLGADPARIAVGGDSAGGNLAAVVALAAKAGEARPPAFQLLIYPVVDYSVKRPSYRTFGAGFLLSAAEMDWFRDHYLPAPEAAGDWRASPLLAPNHSGLPPAYVLTAGFDPLRDEGEEYARTLQAAGVPTVLRRHDGLLHSFVNQTQVNRPARDAMLEAAGALRLALAPRATS